MKEKLPPNPADIHGPNAGEPGYDAIKKGINESGEDLYIGTREEIDRAKAKVESEGRAPDMASYIRLHKEVGVPRDQLERILPRPEFDNFDALAPGYAEILGAYPERMRMLYYKDAQGNLAVVKIDITKIDSLASAGKNFTLQDELDQLGFTRGFSLFGLEAPSSVVAEYHDRLAREEQAGTRKVFSF